MSEKISIGGTKTYSVNAQILKTDCFNEKSVRIKLSNIRFDDSHEQYKFEQMKMKNTEQVVEEIESLLNRQTLTISFD